jgi:hypothetical protein
LELGGFGGFEDVEQVGHRGNCIGCRCGGGANRIFRKSGSSRW